MSECPDLKGAASRAHTIAAALDLGRSLDLWSLALVTLALISLLWISFPLSSTICLVGSILAGGTQKIFALRVAFDAALFRHWTDAWSKAATQCSGSTMCAADLASFDQALAACGLRKHPDDAARDLDSRLRGAGELLRWQVLALVIQLAAMMVAVIAMRLPVAG